MTGGISSTEIVDFATGNIAWINQEFIITGYGILAPPQKKIQDM